jgi:hypothetical protein
VAADEWLRLKDSLEMPGKKLDNPGERFIEIFKPDDKNTLIKYTNKILLFFLIYNI